MVVPPPHSTRLAVPFLVTSTGLRVHHLPEAGRKIYCKYEKAREEERGRSVNLAGKHGHYDMFTFVSVDFTAAPRDICMQGYL